MNYLQYVTEIKEEKDIEKTNQLLQAGWLLIEVYQNNGANFVLAKFSQAYFDLLSTLEHR